MRKLILNRPDDWHVHFRDGDYLQHTVNDTARHFSRALVMPNLKPPLTSLSAIESYRERISAVLPAHHSFMPYISFYLNESLKPEDLQKASAAKGVLGAKLYPAGATTNSEAGIKSLKAIYPLLDIMQEKDLVLQIHGEVTSGDIFYRERLFIEEHLSKLVQNFPKLRIVLEHISTQSAVEFVKKSSEKIAATITVHHLLYNRNHLLSGGIRPHLYCLPVLKKECDQYALQEAAFSANPKFFAGTDSAPHAITNKESTCGCAGIYSAPYALPLYTQLFDEAGQLSKLNAFLSEFGAGFYRLPVNSEQIELIEKPQRIPEKLCFGSEFVVPIAAGETIKWSVNEIK